VELIFLQVVPPYTVREVHSNEIKDLALAWNVLLREDVDATQTRTQEKKKGEHMSLYALLLADDPKNEARERIRADVRLLRDLLASGGHITIEGRLAWTSELAEAGGTYHVERLRPGLIRAAQALGIPVKKRGA